MKFGTVGRSILLAGVALSATMTMHAQSAMAMLPEGTGFVARLDLGALRETAAYRELTLARAGKHARFQEEFLAATGIAPAAVSRAWLAGIRQGEGALILEAEINMDEIIAAVTAKPECEQVEMPGTRLAVTFPDRRRGGDRKLAVVTESGMIVAGDADYVKRILAVAAGDAAGLAATAQTRLTSLSGPGLFRAVLLALPAEVAAKKPALAGIAGATLAANLTDEFDCHLDLTFTAPGQAVAVVQIIQGMLALHQLNQAPAGTAVRDQVRRHLSENFELVHEDCEVRMATRLDAATVDAILVEATSK